MRIFPFNILGIFIFTFAVLFIFPAVAHPLTLDELTSYQTALRTTMEDVFYEMPPGAHFNTLTRQEQKDRKKALYPKLMASPRSAMEFYERVYRDLAERIASVAVEDPQLAAWHKKLIAALKASYEITADALPIMSIPDENERSRAALEKRISIRTEQDTTTYRSLTDEIDTIALPLIPDKKDRERLIEQTPVNLCIEHTWK